VEFRSHSGTDWKCVTCLVPANTAPVSVPILPFSLDLRKSALLSPLRSASGFEDLPFQDRKAFNSIYDNSVNSVIHSGNFIDSCLKVFTSVLRDFGKDLVISHCNINGIMGKFEEIREILQNHKFLFFGISETKLDINDCFFHSQFLVT